MFLIQYTSQDHKKAQFNFTKPHLSFFVGMILTGTCFHGLPLSISKPWQGSEQLMFASTCVLLTALKGSFKRIQGHFFRRMPMHHVLLNSSLTGNWLFFHCQWLSCPYTSEDMIKGDPNIVWLWGQDVRFIWAAKQPNISLESWDTCFLHPCRRQMFLRRQRGSCNQHRIASSIPFTCWSVLGQDTEL